MKSALLKSIKYFNFLAKYTNKNRQIWIYYSSSNIKLLYVAVVLFYKLG